MPKPLDTTEAIAQRVIRERQRQVAENNIDHQLVALPLKPILDEKLPNGWRSYIALFRLLPQVDDERLRLIDAYLLLEKRARRTKEFKISDITPEMVCEVADVTPGHFLGLITESAYTAYQPVSGLIVGMNHPKIVQAMVDRACSVDGTRDGELLMKMTGWMPQPSSTSITNQIFNSNKAIAAEADDGGGMESFESTTLRTSEILRAASDKQISAPVESPSNTLDVDFSVAQKAEPAVK